MKSHWRSTTDETEPRGSVGEVSDMGWVSKAGARIDHEKALLLRSIVLPILDDAETWAALKIALEEKGLGVAIQRGRLMLTDKSTGTSICTGRFLGKPLNVLVSRLGKPHVRLGQENNACGEILH